MSNNIMELQATRPKDPAGEIEQLLKDMGHSSKTGAELLEKLRLQPDFDLPTLLKTHLDLQLTCTELFLHAYHPSAGGSLKDRIHDNGALDKLWGFTDPMLKLLKRAVPSVPVLDQYIPVVQESLASYQHIYSLLASAFMADNEYERLLYALGSMAHRIGVLATYRLSVTYDDDDQEQWQSQAQFWFQKALKIMPAFGGSYHDLALIKRSNAVDQLFLLSKSLCTSDPLPLSYESLRVTVTSVSHYSPRVLSSKSSISELQDTMSVHTSSWKNDGADSNIGAADLGNLSKSLFPVLGGSRLNLKVETNGEICDVFDASCGAAVACFGNGDGGDISQPHGIVVDKVKKQLDSLCYAMHGYFTSEVNEELTKFLTNSANSWITEEIEAEWQRKPLRGSEGYCEHLDESLDKMSHVLVLNSGSEAIEAMIKVVTQYWHDKWSTEQDEVEKRKLQKRRIFISLEISYHGNTIGALSLSDFPVRQEKYALILWDDWLKIDHYYPYRARRKGESEVEHVDRLVNQLVDLLEKRPDEVAAVVLEPVSGAALGCQTFGEGYLQKVKEACRKYGAILVYDEIMCGLYRTGPAFAWLFDQGKASRGPEFEWAKNIAPDILTMGKGMGAGVQPVSGLMSHPGACAAALAVQEIMNDNYGHALVLNIKERSQQLEKLLMQKIGPHQHVGEVRGRGLFWAIEFVRDKKTKEPFGGNISYDIARFGFIKKDNKIAVYPGAWELKGKGKGRGLHKGDHIILAPAFIITESEIVYCVESLTALINEFDWNAYLKI
ncbi:pyridoxal phosphate-dependent transferase [Xylariales sp. PMI_506]|nr:pyridoxal phosphate-dependent transferase [Xylariales sp. PMI_506]